MTTATLTHDLNAEELAWYLSKAHRDEQWWFKVDGKRVNRDVHHNGETITTATSDNGEPTAATIRAVFTAKRERFERRSAGAKKAAATRAAKRQRKAEYVARQWLGGSTWTRSTCDVCNACTTPGWIVCRKCLPDVIAAAEQQSKLKIAALKDLLENGPAESLTDEDGLTLQERMERFIEGLN